MEGREERLWRLCYTEEGVGLRTGRRLKTAFKRLRRFSAGQMLAMLGERPEFHARTHVEGARQALWYTLVTSALETGGSLGLSGPF